MKTILPRCRPGGLGLRARNVLAGRLRVQVALAAALLCGTAVLLLQELKQRTASDGLINQVREAQLSTERLLLTLEDAETGQRGYLLTGNAAYLTPYEAAEAHLADRLRQLAAVPVSANPEWAGHVERISRVATAKMAELRRTVALSQAGDRAAALEVVQTDEGQQVMDAIRAEIEALRANADAQLTRARRQEWSYGLAVAGTASGLALLVCLLLGGLYVAQRRARLVLAEFTSAFGLAQGMIRDLNGCITYWNSGAERLYGYPESEALGRVWHELLHTTFPRPREELEAELLQTGQWQGELTHKRRDGAELVLASHWALHRDADGGPALVIEVDNDITALKRAETALAEREARLVEIAETIPGLVFVTDAAGENVYTNRRFQEFVGAPAEALLGKSWVRVLHPEDMPRAGEIWQSSVRTEQAYEAEYRFRRSDGAWHWFLVRAAPLRGSNGAVESWYGVCTDITEMVATREALLRQGEHLERQVAERTTALADSERSLRLLIEGVVDYAILMLDPAGRVKSWNAGAQRTKGYRAEEIIGQHFSRFYTEGDRAAGRPDQALATAAREGRFEDEGWRVRQDGSRFWAHVVIDVIRDDAGTLLGYAKITRDITARRTAQLELQEAERRLAQAQKMEAVGQLTTGVAHDFNNLLQTVAGNLELAGAAARRGNLAAIDRLLENATRAIGRGARLTGQLLSFSRRQTLRAERVLVSRLVNEMIELVRRASGETICVETQVAAGALVHPHRPGAI